MPGNEKNNNSENLTFKFVHPLISQGSSINDVGLQVGRDLIVVRVKNTSDVINGGFPIALAPLSSSSSQNHQAILQILFVNRRFLNILKPDLLRLFLLNFPL